MIRTYLYMNIEQESFNKMRYVSLMYVRRYTRTLSRIFEFVSERVVVDSRRGSSSRKIVAR